MYDDPGPIPQDWTTEPDGAAIARTFRFGSFVEAMAFMASAVPTCERLDHHPEWRNVYDRVEVRLTTHHTGGLTGADTTLAAALDVLAAAVSAPDPGRSED